MIRCKLYKGDNSYVVATSQANKWSSCKEVLFPITIPYNRLPDRVPFNNVSVLVQLHSVIKQDTDWYNHSEYFLSSQDSL